MLRSGEGVTTGSSYCTGDSGKTNQGRNLETQRKGPCKAGFRPQGGFPVATGTRRLQHGEGEMCGGCPPLSCKGQPAPAIKCCWGAPSDLWPATLKNRKPEGAEKDLFSSNLALSLPHSYCQNLTLSQLAKRNIAGRAQLLYYKAGSRGWVWSWKTLN